MDAPEAVLNLVKKMGDSYRATLIAEYEDFVRGAFDRLVEEFGESFYNIANSYSYRLYVRSVQPVLRNDPSREPLPYPNSPHNTYHPKGICEERLRAAAEAYADAQIQAWAGKIHGKLGAIDDVKLCWLTDDYYRITGTRGDREIRIDQQRIFKVSSRGLPFNQFPARIYVDGKFYSAKKYTELFA